MCATDLKSLPPSLASMTSVPARSEQQCEGFLFGFGRARTGANTKIWAGSSCPHPPSLEFFAHPNSCAIPSRATCFLSHNFPSSPRTIESTPLIVTDGEYTCDIVVLWYPSCKSIYSELLRKLQYVRSYTRELLCALRHVNTALFKCSLGKRFPRFPRSVGRTGFREYVGVFALIPSSLNCKNREDCFCGNQPRSQAPPKGTGNEVV